jgi:ribose 5-phosphate isomerase B
MRIAIASDHAGYPLKSIVVETVKEEGHDAIDLGAYSIQPDDYPDYAEKIGTCINEGKADRGVLLCGSGVGASIAANKIKGIYAAVCHDNYSAHQGVEHDAMNVLCIGSRIIGPEVAKELVRTFLRAQFSNEERHKRRVGKIRKIEAKIGE